MSLVVREKNSFEIIPEDTYLAVCVAVYDIGEQYSETYKNYSPQCVLMWELKNVPVIGEDGEPILNKETGEPETQSRLISKTCTMSLSKKAKLRDLLVSWRGREFTEEELAGFNLTNILGVGCNLQVIHKKSGTNTYANVGTVTKMLNGMQLPPPENEPMYFDLDEDGWQMKMEKLPEWIQDRVKESKTCKEKMGYADEDAPF